MIDRDRNILFIHIPKNAGTSVERTVFDNFAFDGSVSREFLFGYDKKLNLNLQHATVSQLLEHDLVAEAELQQLNSFAIVRNPFTRAISGYIWLLKDLKTEGSFEQFLKQQGPFSKSSLKDAPHFVEDHFYSQSAFIYKNNQRQVKTLLRFEDLDQDFKAFSNKMGWNFELNSHFKKNRKSRWKLAKLLTRENRALIVERYREDFENFGYSKDFNRWKYRMGYG